MRYAHTLINHQSIGSVSLCGSSYVLNSGTIAGSYGVAISGGIGEIINSGIIAGTGRGGPLGAIAGIVLYPGRAVTNLAGGTIYGYNDGIRMLRFSTVVNSGSVKGGHAEGINLYSGGAVTNQNGGTISGHGVGIACHSFATVTNQSGGKISGDTGPGILMIGAGTVMNAGSISGGMYGYGIEMREGGSVINTAGATISGVQDGAQLFGNTTLTDAGTIISNLNAIYIGAGSMRVVLQQGARIEGAIVVNTGNTKATLELAAGNGSLASGITNISSIVLDAGANWNLSGTDSNAGAGRITLGSQGVLTVAGLLAENENLGLVGTGTLAVAAGAPSR